MTYTEKQKEAIYRWREKNPDKYKAFLDKHNEKLKNDPDYKEYQANYYIENKEKKLNYSTEYNRVNKEKTLKYANKYYQANKEKIRAINEYKAECSYENECKKLFKILKNLNI